MALFKCKMCGGSLEIKEGMTVIECDYCGTQQTLPKLDDDKRVSMYDRANHFRRNNEFDKAMSIYEQILDEDNTDAEAYWSLVLCRFGIEYVEDPASHKRIPTVNRTQYTSVFDDDNYKSALKYADSYQRHIYEEEAKTINEIQKGILAISQKEKPFDIFICYKESDNGKRTPDSVLAQDLYYQLKQEGFKVFFARITLEDKLGSAYEPYIFAALNSAKVMVVLGTKPDYFNAVWVKNEWSRYLSLIKQGQKKMLIPAYKDMDPYNLPEEFSHLQAQDMSKLGFMQDLIRGIKKIVNSDKPQVEVVKETVVANANANIEPLIKRAFIFLEDEDWKNANIYCEKVLDASPENAYAYVGKLMAEKRIKKQDELVNAESELTDNINFKKACRYASPELLDQLNEYNRAIIDRKHLEDLESSYSEACAIVKDVEDFGDLSPDCFDQAFYYFDLAADYKDSKYKIEQCKKTLYTEACKLMESSTTVNGYSHCIDYLTAIPDYENYKDCVTMIFRCNELKEEARKEQIYKKACSDSLKPEISKDELSSVIQAFQSIKDYKDSDFRAAQCQMLYDEFIAEEQRQKAIEEAKLLEEEKKDAKRRKRNKKIITAVVIIGIALLLVGIYKFVSLPNETLFNICAIIGVILGIILSFLMDMWDTGWGAAIACIIITTIIVVIVLGLIISGLQFITGNTPTLIGSLW